MFLQRDRTRLDPRTRRKSLTIDGTPVLTATEDEAYTGFTASATGGTEPYVYSLVGDWPAGIEIDPDTGEVSGTPTESGTFADLSVRVTDDEASTDDLDTTFTLEVGAAGYVAEGVNFDGTNDYLTRGAGLTGAVDSKVGLLVFWFKMAGGDGADQFFLHADTSGANKVLIQRLAAGTLRVFLRDSSGNTTIFLVSSTTYTASMSGYACLMSAWDGATGTRQMYVGDFSVLAGGSVCENVDTDWTTTTFSIGATAAGASKGNYDLADLRLWIDQTLDLSVEANRRKFIDAAGKPVNPADSGLTTAIIDLHGATATWHTNQGSGGGFTENGEITDAATSPSD